MDKLFPFKELHIFFFSGTGNARKCAEWIAENGRTLGLEVRLHNIDRFLEFDFPAADSTSLMGFCFPTHGFNAPPIMLKFLSKVPVTKNASAFILNTRGGLKMYKFFIPGLSGLAQFLPAMILCLKGYKIVGMQPVDLPSNWLLLHPAIRGKMLISMFRRYNRIVNQFSKRILSGKTRYQAFWSFPFDILIIPVAIGYYLVGRFFLSKTLIATSRCDSCKLCVKNCPVGAIQWIREKPFWTWRCESCMRCVSQCPERAIQTAHSFTAFVIYLSILLSSWLFNTFLLKSLWQEIGYDSLMADIFWNVLVSAIMILLVFGGYRIVHYLMKYKWFSNLIEFSSLSRFKWWGRYLPLKILRKARFR